MKKILFINTTIDKGGAALVARDLFFSLKDSQEMKPYFAFGRGKSVNGDNIFKISNSVEVYLHGFLVRFFGLEGYGCNFTTKRLLSLIEKENFDLIHLHNLHGYYLNIWDFLNYLSKKDIPIIWTLHDEWIRTWLPAHTMNCEHCTTLEGSCTNTYHYPKAYIKIFDRFIFLKKKKTISSLKNLTFVCPSEWLKKQIENSYLKNKDIRLIYNGVDTNIFNNTQRLRIYELRSKYGLPLNKKILLFYSNLKDKTKKTDFVIKLAKEFKNKKDFLFLGFGPSKFLDNENVKTIGFIKEKEELANLYSLADLLIFPSIAETLPTVVIESIMCGLPVVCFDIGPFREIVGNKYGKLIQKIDFRDFKKGVEEVIETLKYWENIPDKEFINKFNFQTMVSNYINLYKEKLL